MAYADLEDVMDIAESMIEGLVKDNRELDNWSWTSSSHGRGTT